MNAGKLRHRIVLDQPINTQIASGEEIVTWQVYGVVWAMVEPLRGREQFQANQVLAEMDTRITIRWSPNVDAIRATWRARFQGLIYDFKSITHVNLAHREIEIMAASGVNNG